jgi:hypothetical protein
MVDSRPYDRWRGLWAILRYVNLGLIHLGVAMGCAQPRSEGAAKWPGDTRDSGAGGVPVRTYAPGVPLTPREYTAWTELTCQLRPQAKSDEGSGV